MPRFYFDVHDGDDVAVDPTGTELADAAVARDEATRTLSEIAAEEIPRDGLQRIFRIVVRDEHHEALLELRLTFNAASA